MVGTRLPREMRQGRLPPALAGSTHLYATGALSKG
jgi:hypothetical protein